MLHEFLTANRDELIARCVAKVAKRPAPPPTTAEMMHGIPLFLSQITETLRSEAVWDEPASRRISGAMDPDKTPTATEIGESAAEHGDELQRKGFTVDQVVHDYGDLCQAITELAVEQDAPIAVTEFRTLNRCLDNAMADAVTRFGSQHDRSVRQWASQDTNERLGILAHELRGKLNVARLAVEAIKRGTVGIAGATGAILDRSLTAMRDIIDRSFAEVRLGAGLSPHRERILIRELFEEVRVFASLQARAKGLGLAVRPGDLGLAIDADRHTIASAMSNLVENAIKFTPVGGRITMSAETSNGRVLIEIADQCGGLPTGTHEDLFRPFHQRSGDRTGLGLGLAISRRGVEANDGRLSVANRLGEGCVFTIDLPVQ
ncbi:MAG: HAMP domain-containing sensor histidine kinase [Gemmatimonadales bacterium]|nr:HAMP domain-containing sensor histidine kinase [Gemmatimonadales bacterium]